MNRELEKLLQEIEDNAADHAKAGQIDFALKLREYTDRIRSIFSNTGIRLVINDAH